MYQCEIKRKSSTRQYFQKPKLEGFNFCILSTFCLTFEILKLPSREILKVAMTWLTQDKSFLLDVFSFSISDSWEVDQRDSHEKESQNQSKSKYVRASPSLYEFNF